MQITKKKFFLLKIDHENQSNFTIKTKNQYISNYLSICQEKKKIYI